MSEKRLFLGLLLVLILSLIATVPATAQLGEDDRLLVWAAPVGAPVNIQDASQLGEIGYLSGNGEFEAVQAVPEGTQRLALCGEQPVSPDGKSVAFFMGSDNDPDGGGLYILKEGQLPQEVTKIQSLGCIGGNGRFQYSKDGQHFAYIEYASDWIRQNYAAGDLKIRRLDNYEVVGDLDSGNVVAFDLIDGGAIFLEFLSNSLQETPEATLNIWDGSDDDELLTFTATEGCNYRHGYLQATNDYYWVILAERCQDTNWQLFRTDKDGANAVMALQTSPRGGLSAGSETNNLIFSPDGSRIYYTLPSGLAQNTVSLESVPVDDFQATDTLIDEVHLDWRTQQETIDARPQFSADGNWLVSVARDGNTRWIAQVNLSTGETFLAEVAGLNETVPFMAITPDNQTIIFAAGEVGTFGNSMYRLPIGTLEAERIERGTFSRWGLLSPDGQKVVIAEWQEKPEDRPLLNDYTNLVVLNLSDGERTTLYEGLTIDEDDQGNTRFMIPLYWLP